MAAQTQQHTLLVIDDSASARYVVKATLESHGYKVFVAESGEIGLELVNEVVPELILLDINMPGLDGFEVCKLVKEVKVDGKGMSAEVRSRIFDPFFTTKPLGKGTGLGLSLSLGIVENHNGLLQVTSSPGQGTTFRLLLPSLENEQLHQNSRKRQEQRQSQPC